eukprot:SAG22_NODE_3708_length_1564_cov_1.243686_2_plen_80_part_00
MKHDTCGGYNGEPANECGVGTLGGGNCIRNSTGKMAAALKKYAAAAGRSEIVYCELARSPHRAVSPACACSTTRLVFCC